MHRPTHAHQLERKCNPGCKNKRSAC